MNSRDYENLQFMLHVDQSMQNDWWNSLTDDDKNYAMELLQEYGRGLDLQEKMLQSDEVHDVSQAALLLQSFTLQHK